MASGTTLAIVATVFSAAACFTPRSTSACALHRMPEAARIATGVVPSPNTGRNCPSVALTSTRQVTHARQQVIQ